MWTPERDERTWATYTASEAVGRRTSLARRDDPDMLTEQVRPWPTPTARDDRSAGGREHTKGGTCLADEAAQIRPWPTATTGDANGSGNRSAPTNDCHDGTSLTDAVRADRHVAGGRPWASPTCADARSGWTQEDADRAERRNLLGDQIPRGRGPREQLAEQLADVVRELPRQAPLGEREAPGRRLNPRFVESLMGYPDGWTLPDGPRLDADPAPRWPRGRYPAEWDRSQVWPGYAWEAPRTLPDGPPAKGRPAQLRALGNAVVPQQGAMAIRAALEGEAPGLFAYRQET